MLLGTCWKKIALHFCIINYHINAKFCHLSLTGFSFSCSGISSGKGTPGGLGLVRENSFGCVALAGAFFNSFCWAIISARRPMWFSSLGRHLTGKGRHIFWLWRFRLGRVINIRYTWEAVRSRLSPHMQNHRFYSTPLESTCWGVWRRKSGTARTFFKWKTQCKFLHVSCPWNWFRDYSYGVHLFYSKWCDDVAEAVEVKVIVSKCDEITDN